MRERDYQLLAKMAFLQQSASSLSARGVSMDVSVADLDADSVYALVTRGWLARKNDHVRLVSGAPGLSHAVSVAADLDRIEVTRALSLWQPWAWAVASGHKPIENRGWKPRNAMNTWIAIHAGMRVDKDAIATVRDVTGEDPVLDHGVILGIARLVDVIPAGARESELDEHERVWFNGPYGWRFDAAIQFSDPVPCRGYQSLWTLKPSVRNQIAGRLR